MSVHYYIVDCTSTGLLVVLLLFCELGIKNLIRKLSIQPIHFYLKVCVTAAGRNDRSTEEFATVDWMAYQGAPDGGVTGKVRVPKWWTGSQCREINLPQVSCLLLLLTILCVF